MAYLRKLKSGKWQVLIRKANQPHIIKSFFDKGTASKFARERHNEIRKMNLKSNTKSRSKYVVSTIR